MPGYKTHDTIGIVSIAPIAIVSLYLGTTLSDTVTLAIGVLIGTYFLSPDLDLHSRIYLRWGLLRWIWIPYQKLIPHRSWLSHSGPLSATLRFMYLLAWIIPCIRVFGITAQNLHLQSFCVIMWIAFMIADTLHVFMDTIWKD